MITKLRIGTRGSELALWQTNHIKTLLEHSFPEISISIEIIKTTGDKILDTPLAKIGDKGLFTKELEHALLQRRIDLAVHSLKDVPTFIPSGLTLAAILERDDVHDVFIAHSKNGETHFASLPLHAAVATGSLRRKSQLLGARPDLNIIDLRGNLNTRMKKLDESQWNGMILAKAGVTRLGWSSRISDILPFDLMLPAVGQGALAVETRSDDDPVIGIIGTLQHKPTAYAVTAERALLRELEGGCQIPIGALGTIIGETLRLDAVVGSLDGKKIIRASKTGTITGTERTGIELAKELLKQGARDILEEIRHSK
jgi:hydroxymethylbilane synthase